MSLRNARCNDKDGTATDSSFNTQAKCSKCPPSASIHFVTLVTRELVTLRSTAAFVDASCSAENSLE